MSELPRVKQSLERIYLRGNVILVQEIFNQGHFNRYSEIRLDAAQAPMSENIKFAEKRTTVFISHKHEDLNELKGLLGFLEKTYGVQVYIDSRDLTMPRITSGKTAENIKDRIQKCDKFILLATNGAIESKWCNWELGYGDAKKFRNHIALFPMKPSGTSNDAYKGNEYMQIYPHIAYYDGSERYENGEHIPSGYRVRWIEGDKCHSESLSVWFQKR